MKKNEITARSKFSLRVSDTVDGATRLADALNELQNCLLLMNCFNKFDDYRQANMQTIAVRMPQKC